MAYPHLGSFAVKGGDNTQSLPAGLPNIEGSSDVGGYSTKSVFPSPLFPTVSLIDNAMFSISTDNKFELVTFGFDASLSNSIYGSSTTVQPASIVLINQIKY